jgi:hypothetical protein
MATSKPTLPAVKVKDFTLTKFDIRAFEKAVERRTGRPAFEDWLVIARVYAKASKAALDESGQASRNNPTYKRAFSRIIAVLPPISSSDGTAKMYRAALLNQMDYEPAFLKWYEKTQPRASNPLDLWHAFRTTLPGNDDGPRERQINGHEQELARVQEQAAATITAQQDRIAELETGNPSAKVSVEELVRQAWETEWSAHDFNPQVVAAVRARLIELIEEVANEYSPGITAAAGDEGDAA